MIAGVLGKVLWGLGAFAVYFFVFVPLVRALGFNAAVRRVRRERYRGDDD